MTNEIARAVATAAARAACVTARYARTQGVGTSTLIGFAQEAAEAAFGDWADAADLDEQTYGALVAEIDDLIRTGLE